MGYVPINEDAGAGVVPPAAAAAADAAAAASSPSFASSSSVPLMTDDDFDGPPCGSSVHVPSTSTFAQGDSLRPCSRAVSCVHELGRVVAGYEAEGRRQERRRAATASLRRRAAKSLPSQKESPLA